MHLYNKPFLWITGHHSLGLFSTLTPPLYLEINGERKTLFVCLVNDLSENSLGVIWFSNGNGSMLDSYTYGILKEEDGSFSTIAQISIPSKEFESWNIVICSVAQNKNSRIWNTTYLQISEEQHMDDLCLSESQGVEEQMLSTEILHNRTQELHILAIRTLLFKILMFNVLMTCCILYKR
ncbi:pre T-cell antigen receptor alpha isoform X2 [Thamnophis elegans]|uniref:pre T-cell antigen receptor alpha isoform X2 n=1 Tax=Thamnophis elegans TaxID=35005 RepID=UPI00137738E3|nr:pre T-cell antigen receptor alpha isoform X2 [Thamnophis elegans]